MERDAGPNFPHSKKESWTSPPLDSQTLNNLSRRSQAKADQLSLACHAGLARRSLGEDGSLARRRVTRHVTASYFAASSSARIADRLTSVGMKPVSE